LLEGGTRVPLIANWPGVTPKGKLNTDLIDFTDMFATFAEIGGAKLPEGVKLDGRSFAPQIHGEKGNPRDWVFVQLGNGWFSCDHRWKLNQRGELFDLKDAPWQEIPVAADSQDEAAKAARSKLQGVLDTLKPPTLPRDNNPNPNKKGQQARPKAQQRKAATE
jgi:arylsulfatase A